MPNRYDIAYAAALALSAPVWLALPRARRKVLKALRLRTGGYPARDGSRPAIMIHAVSMGEISATRGLVQRLAELRPGLRFIVSTTTDTGYERGQQLYGQRDDVILVRYPLDFSRAIRRCLDAARPDVVALMELEVWPNFLRHCERRRIPALLINGRVTPSSFRHYRMGRAITRAMFRRLSAVCAQDELFAARFAQLGAANVQVTGTMKFDSATLADRAPGDGELAGELGLAPHALNPATSAQRIWVAGSTGPGEEELILRVYRALLTKHAPLRLAIVPRHPERFSPVAALIRQAGFQVIRRSQAAADIAAAASQPHSLFPPVILGDTMGELRKFYSLADVVFVGRSLVDLGHRQHGSDMIEPAALGKPVIVGPFTANFADAMLRFREADAILEVPGERQLLQCVSVLLSTPAQAAEMGRRAQEVVRQSQGATERHARVILEHLERRLALTPQAGPSSRAPARDAAVASPTSPRAEAGRVLPSQTAGGGRASD